MKCFLDLYMKVLKENYINFKGRAARPEFWVFIIINIIVSAILEIVGGLISSKLGLVLGGLFSLAVLLPTLSVAARRMHDLGKGAGWICVVFIPIAGCIWFIVLCAMAGEPADNRFGAVPEACHSNNGGCCCQK